MGLILRWLFKICFFFRLELNMELPAGVEASNISTPSVVSQEQDELSKRLARLRQTE